MAAVTCAKPRKLTIKHSSWEECSREELERQMSPTHWTPKKTPEQVFSQFIADSVQGTGKAQSEMHCEFNISFGSQNYDLYGADMPVDAPIFFFVHGGAWQEGSKEISGHFALLNQANGFKSVVVDYSLAPAATIPQMQTEVVTALQKVVNDFPHAKIVLAGHSAGGQLLAQLLHTAPTSLPPHVARNIAGLILLAGVYDLRPFVNTSYNNALQLTIDDAAALSPLLQPFAIPNGLNLQTLRVLVVVGGNESFEFQRQALDYYERLNEIIPNTIFWQSDNDDHFTLISNMGKEESEIAQQIETHVLRRIVA